MTSLDDHVREFNTTYVQLSRDNMEKIFYPKVKSAMSLSGVQESKIQK